MSPVPQPIPGRKKAAAGGERSASPPGVPVWPRQQLRLSAGPGRARTLKGQMKSWRKVWLKAEELRLWSAMTFHQDQALKHPEKPEPDCLKRTGPGFGVVGSKVTAEYCFNLFLLAHLYCDIKRF